MPTAYLGLGSNLGDREQLLDAAVARLRTLPQTSLLARSPIYETPPMGPQDQPPYLNMAASIRTNLPAVQLIMALQAIELELGRQPRDERRHWGPRPIDIDLLLYGDAVIDTPALTVPHPGLHERWFVLKPLADIAPNAEHPVLKRNVAQLLTDLQPAALQKGSKR